MTSVYIFVAVLIIVAIIFLVLFAKFMFKPIIKMRDAGSGERTKFIIDTSNKEYDYYKNIVERWLKSNNYKINKNDYILKYHDKVKGITYNFGFNYYLESTNIVIEAWLNVLGAEYPLTEKLYERPENEKTIADVVARKDKDMESNDVLVGQQGKDEYINLLKSLIVIDDDLKEINNVSLKDAK